MVRGGAGTAAAVLEVDDDEPRVDPRARRTRAALQQALLDLATDRDLDAISVAELTTAAGVNRATFYLHYSDKDALLLDAMTSVMAETAAGAAAAPLGELSDQTHPPRHTLAFFRELDRHAPLYRRILGPNGSPVVVAHLRDRMQDAIATELERRSTARLPVGVSVEMLAAFLSGAIFGAATVWLQHDVREAPDDMAATVWLLVTTTVTAVPERPKSKRR